MHDSKEPAVLVGLAVVFAAATLLVLWPFAPWILLAIWVSSLVRPTYARLRARIRRRSHIAAAVTTLGLVLLTAPMIVLIASLADDAVALVRSVLASDRVQNALNAVSGQAHPRAAGEGVVDIAVSQGTRAWGLAQQIAGTAARVVIGLVITIGGIYVLLVDGRQWYGWLEDHAPLRASSFRRLADAFVETGRGLFFGILGAGFAQAIVATVLYVVLRVPQAFELGVLTLACSVIPAIGTAIVWLPIAIGLALGGRDTAAVILMLAGIFVIGTIDNLVRPYLARRGRLQLPMFVVAVAMFGGVALMGARGLILGPLIVRLAKEVLAIRHDDLVDL